MEVRGQFAVVSSLLLPHCSGILKSVCQAWWHVLLPAEPSCWPFFKNSVYLFVCVCEQLFTGTCSHHSACLEVRGQLTLAGLVLSFQLVGNWDF